MATQEEDGGAAGAAFAPSAVAPERATLALAVLAGLTAIPIALFLADAVAVTVLGPGGGMTGLSFRQAAILLVASAAMRVGLDALAAHRAGLAAVDAKRLLRSRLTRAFARWSPLEIRRPGAGEMAGLIADQVETIDPWIARYAIARARLMAVPAAILLAVAPASWLVALLLALAGPLIPLLTSLIGMRARALGRERLDELGSLAGLVVDRLRGLETLRLYDAGERTAAELEAAGERIREASMAVLKIAFLSSAVLEFFAALGIALSAIVIGFNLIGWMAFGGTFGPIGLAEGLFMLLLAPEFFAPFREFSAAYHDRAAAEGLADRIGGAFGPERLQCPPSGAAAANPGVTLMAEAVSLRLAGRERPVLDGIGIAIAEGERVAIVGPSGAGKSLLLGILAGLVPPTAGRTAGAAPGRIAFMGQEPFVLSGSLVANLDPDGRVGDRARLAEALDTVGLAHVAARGAGLLAPVGETGAGLSRGELRRLAIARALVSGAPILLADEPTADLDPVAADRVADALLAAAEGRTLVVATHDGRLAARMERRVEIRGGRVVPAGNEPSPAAAALSRGDRP